jgi:hypothetical protein
MVRSSYDGLNVYIVIDCWKGWPLQIYGNWWFSGRQLSLVAIGASVSGPKITLHLFCYLTI